MDNKKIGRAIYRLDLINNDLVQLATIEASDITDDEKQMMIDNLLESLSDPEYATTRGVSLYAELEKRIEIFKDAENDLKSKRVKFEQFYDRLKTVLTNFVELNGGRVETPLVTLSIRPSEFVEIIDAEKIPSEYIDLKTEIHPRKMDIKSVLKNGGEVAGCRLWYGRNLQIK
jgi:hypothetical protein